MRVTAHDAAFAPGGRALIRMYFSVVAISCDIRLAVSSLTSCAAL